MLSPDPASIPEATPEDLIPLVVILGPTAAGKTEIAIALARRLGAEIVSADSRLFYIGLDIGTAKPSPAEREQVAHHLIDVTPPDKVWSLATFQAEANRIIREIDARGKLPFLVGGTGQYIHAVTEGWEIPKAHASPTLRLALERWATEIGAGGLHDRLALLDPQAGQTIDPSNVRRTVRALEVIFSTGRIFSAQRRRHPSPYQVLQLGLTRPRSQLYHRIDLRIDGMIQAGLVEEVRGLLAQGYAPDLPALSAIGYREIIAYLQDRISLDEAVRLIKRQTRVFVRRQANWFKENDPAICWFSVDEKTIDAMETKIRAWRTSLK